MDGNYYGVRSHQYPFKVQEVDPSVQRLTRVGILLRPASVQGVLRYQTSTGFPLMTRIPPYLPLHRRLVGCPLPFPVSLSIFTSNDGT